MRRHIALAAALVAVAALAFGAGSAAAADTPSLGDAVAARLGITGDQLRAAFKAELNARIDAAVAAGRLTPEQGTKLKERVANAKGLGIVVRRGFAQRHKALVGRIVQVHRLGAAAKYLGMTPKELRTARQSGRSLAQIAASKGKSVDGLVAAIVAPAKARAAKAVSNGKLTQQRADELIARLTERVKALVERVLPAHEVLVHLRASKTPKPGSTLHFTGPDGAGFDAQVLGRGGPQDSLFHLRLPAEPHALLDCHGHVPLPPYITHADEAEDAQRYQTVFASRPGAVAAPTASLHFDEAVLEALKARGVGFANVTLHVGAGTFQPVRSENLAEHRMHSEWFEVGEATVAAIQAARACTARRPPAARSRP